jgi:ribokinase
MSRVVVVGGANWDRAWRLGRLPAAGETVAGEVAGEGPGGKGLNIAVGVARLAEEVALIARLGDDADGARLRAWLQSEGVLDEGVVEATGEVTGRAAILLAGGESTIAVASAANAGLSGEEVTQALARVGEGCALLVLQAEAPDAALEAAARWALERRAGAAPVARRRPEPRVLLSPAPARELSAVVWEATDLCVCNRGEAEQLTGVGVADPVDAEEAAIALCERGPEVAVVTLGDEGAVVARAGRATYLPPFTVEAVDQTGAGDCAVAAFARGVVAGLDVFAATGYAMAAAAICVTRAGAAAAMPTLDEVDRIVHSVDLRQDPGMQPVRLSELL